LSLTSSVPGGECVASLVVRPFTELSGIAYGRVIRNVSVVVAHISVRTMFRRIAPGNALRFRPLTCRVRMAI
jgi:hypothetical protein